MSRGRQMNVAERVRKILRRPALKVGTSINPPVTPRLREHTWEWLREVWPDLVPKFEAFESGAMTDQEIIDFFQEIVKLNIAWNIGGGYPAMAGWLMEEGLIEGGGKYRSVESLGEYPSVTLDFPE